jgi:hypothetical protein
MFDASQDTRHLKKRLLNPLLNLDLKLFGPDRHIMYRFNPILYLIDLPMNGLDDTPDVPRNEANVTAKGSYLDTDGIDQFLCFPSCPADLKQDRDGEDESQHQNERNDCDANCHQCLHSHLPSL